MRSLVVAIALVAVAGCDSKATCMQSWKHSRGTDYRCTLNYPERACEALPGAIKREDPVDGLQRCLNDGYELPRGRDRAWAREEVKAGREVTLSK